MLADILAQLQQKQASVGESGVTAAFELNWECLEPEAQKLACLLSLFALAPILWSLVELAASASDLELDIKASCTILVQRYLLQQLASDTYQIHERIRELLRLKLEDLEEASKLKRGFCQAMVAVARDIPPTPNQIQIAKASLAIPHLTEAATAYQDWLSDEELTSVFVGLDKFYKEPPVLILDDDEYWLAQHERRLRNAGINCYATQDSSEAIKFALKNKIKIALIDEILFIPPISNSQEGELQRWQGKGVIREIVRNWSVLDFQNLKRRQRNGVIREIVRAGLIDTHFIFITAAPAKRSGWNTPAFLQEVFWQEVTSLRKILGVNVINKSEIESNPEDSYAHLIDIIKRVKRTKDPVQLVQRESWMSNLRKLLALIRINISFAFMNVNIGAINVSSKTQGNQIGSQHNRLGDEETNK
ncbi:hypothetical protein [Scytonema sp. UIC 10036]|uniref:hypothetical protein n=1 Tax=Scytonema sp. UIC 10036 TaxID=2304196 RepID=UPI001FA980E2|nr:hypothetical protein [Scytonema sp. UIC 10036]